jgi:molybdopterin/thiamine biosynthesis adenylyltransferase
VREKMLSQDELLRYQRQLMIPDFGEEAQTKLKDAHAIIVGVGGLGCSSAMYLTAAGVGHITLVDFDTVELSDLNRQILYSQDDIGEKKVVAASRRLNKLNSSVHIDPLFSEIKEDNVLGIISGAQVVLDGTDNLASRLILNAGCVELKIPFIVGGVSRLRGMVTTIIPGETPCLACLQPEGLRGLGVLGVIPALIANIQTLEAIKLLVGHKPALAGRLLLLNGDDMKFRNYEIQRNESCQVCSSK